MINIQNANTYFDMHMEANKWFTLDDQSKETMLQKAESYIDNAFDLRDGTKDTINYKHAIYEQTIFMLTFDRERHKLQREGVTMFKVDDLSFHMTTSLISPVAHLFLKRFIYKKVGRIT
ncbi:hypothetical protein ACM26V_16850 [Salipaludibacillus sp. HK11]|uniref:hypothetical protein n=1 Tax=Salipaludibacillus sp. HK11 TaxID=3394320 RepID=UPI0039FBDF87